MRIVFPFALIFGYNVVTVQRLVDQKKVRVVVVGGANVDIQGFSSGDFVPADSNPGRIVRSSGGVGRNIAENLARLGMDVSLLTVFGSSEEGLALREACEDAGVDVSHSLVVPGPTPTYLALMDKTGALMAAVADMGAMERLTPCELEKRTELLGAASYIVVDTNIPKESLAWLVDHYGRTGHWSRVKAAGPSLLHVPRLVLDPVSSTKARNAVGMLGAFSLAKPNRAECAVLAGIQSDDPQELCNALCQKGQSPEELYLSLGEEGLYCYVETGEAQRIGLPPPARCPKPVNRSGAGDAALAALVWATERGFTLKEKAQYALTASALTAASEDSVCKTLTEERLLYEKRRMYDFDEGENV